MVSHGGFLGARCCGHGRRGAVRFGRPAITRPGWWRFPLILNYLGQGHHNPTRPTTRCSNWCVLGDDRVGCVLADPALRLGLYR